MCDDRNLRRRGWWDWVLMGEWSVPALARVRDDAAVGAAPMRTIIMLAVLVPTVGAEPSAQSGGVSRRLCQWLGVSHASLTARSPRADPQGRRVPKRLV